MPSDREKVLGYLYDKGLRCPSCGTYDDEFKDNMQAYVVEAHRCIGCEKIATEQKSWEDSDGSKGGIYFRLVKPDEETTVRLPND